MYSTEVHKTFKYESNKDLLPYSFPFFKVKERQWMVLYLQHSHDVDSHFSKESRQRVDRKMQKEKVWHYSRAFHFGCSLDISSADPVRNTSGRFCWSSWANIHPPSGSATAKSVPGLETPSFKSMQTQFPLIARMVGGRDSLLHKRDIHLHLALERELWFDALHWIEIVSVQQHSSSQGHAKFISPNHSVHL